jgi:hypothetical protein
MPGFTAGSWRKTHGWRPFLIAAILLALTEAVLHLNAIWRPAVRISDQWWQPRALAPALEQIIPAHQDLAEAPMLEAYLRALGHEPHPPRVIVIGDSLLWQVPAPPPFHRRLKPLLEARAGKPVTVSSLAMPGLSPVAGFYLFKRMTAEFPPALVIYSVNLIWTGDGLANAVSPATAFIDRDFFGPAEAEAYQALMTHAHAEPEEPLSFVPFRVVHVFDQIKSGSRLRAILLPPAVFSGLSSRCYFASCQQIKDVYWRDLWAKGKREQKNLANYRRFHLDPNESVNYRYLLLTFELARARHVPIIALIPPRNLVMLDQLNARDTTLAAGSRLEALLREQGFPVINCQEAVSEQNFRDSQHLRSDGFDQWIGCLRGSLPSIK